MYSRSVLGDSISDSTGKCQHRIGRTKRTQKSGTTSMRFHPYGWTKKMGLGKGFTCGELRRNKRARTNTSIEFIGLYPKPAAQTGNKQFDCLNARRQAFESTKSPLNPVLSCKPAVSACCLHAVCHKLQKFLADNCASPRTFQSTTLHPYSCLAGERATG